VLNEDVSVFWSDTEITSWIQEGCLDFSTKSLLVEDTISVTLQASKLYYNSSDVAAIANIVELYTVLYYNGTTYKGIIKSKPNVIGNEATNTAGDPKYYSWHDKNLYVWPLTSAAVVAAGGTLSLLCSITTNDITVIRDEYQSIPLMYARAMAKYKDRLTAEGDGWMNLYNQYVGFERSDKYSREVDALDKFKVRGRGGERAAG
jgi:hypothetical protein